MINIKHILLSVIMGTLVTIFSGCSADIRDSNSANLDNIYVECTIIPSELGDEPLVITLTETALWFTEYRINLIPGEVFTCNDVAYTKDYVATLGCDRIEYQFDVPKKTTYYFELTMNGEVAEWEINVREISILSPKSGSSVTLGESFTIQWAVSDGNSATFVMQNPDIIYLRKTCNNDSSLYPAKTGEYTLTDSDVEDMQGTGTLTINLSSHCKDHEPYDTSTVTPIIWTTYEEEISFSVIAPE